MELQKQGVLLMVSHVSSVHSEADHIYSRSDGLLLCKVPEAPRSAGAPGQVPLAGAKLWTNPNLSQHKYEGFSLAHNHKDRTDKEHCWGMPAAVIAISTQRIVRTGFLYR